MSRVSRNIRRRFMVLRLTDLRSGSSLDRTVIVRITQRPPDLLCSSSMVARTRNLVAGATVLVLLVAVVWRLLHSSAVASAVAPVEACADPWSTLILQFPREPLRHHAGESYMIELTLDGVTHGCIYPERPIAAPPGPPDCVLQTVQSAVEGPPTGTTDLIALTMRGQPADISVRLLSEGKPLFAGTKIIEDQPPGCPFVARVLLLPAG